MILFNCSILKSEGVPLHVNIFYRIYLKYWDTIAPYHTCPKLKKSILLPIDVSKIVQYEWLTVKNAASDQGLHFCTVLSVRILTAITVFNVETVRSVSLLFVQACLSQYLG